MVIQQSNKGTTAYEKHSHKLRKKKPSPNKGVPQGSGA
jgi:hypothetical protein